ncbi:PaaI family thioesterase [Gordonia sp. CPCC 206044]|uniref:PaaI family thioesterase n=1 Tax=Gordonia sp. CPCC 206044 TaxID=3140793 RepID=UPI003AF3DE45
MKSGFTVPTDLDPVERHPKAAGPGEKLNRHHPMCYGCGDQSEQGLHLKIIAGDGFTVSATMAAEPRMEGGPGVIHGGVLTTAFDEVMGNVPLLIGPSAVTVHLEVDFAEPIPIGSTLHFRGELLGRQRRKLYTRSTAHLGDPEKIVAQAHAIFVSIDSRAHFADHVANSGLSDEYKDRLSRP